MSHIVTLTCHNMSQIVTSNDDKSVSMLKHWHTMPRQLKESSLFVDSLLKNISSNGCEVNICISQFFWFQPATIVETNSHYAINCEHEINKLL